MPSLVCRLVLLLGVFAVAGCGGTRPAVEVPPGALETAPEADLAAYARVEAALGPFLAGCREGGCAVPVGPGVEVDTVLFVADTVEVRFSRDLGDAPFRPASAAAFTREVAAALARVLPLAPVRVVTRGSAVEDLVPNAARAPEDRDRSRVFAPPVVGPPLVRPAASPHAPTRGLAGRHVALWPSHGWLYSAGTGAWGWQRPRLFTTVEDLLTVGFVVRELTPMLERAGAVVLLPRERDPNPVEVVVDDGGPGYAETGRWSEGPAGFGRRATYAEGENPFRLGGSREAPNGASATWTPDLPEAGDYAVHVSYAPGPGRSEAARYTVRHAGGETALDVNQAMGGGTWVYLGTFRFEAGTAGSVTLSGGGAGTLSADAVRFGGGMGIVARNGEASGYPRWTEAARYYEQYAGAPPYVYNVTGEPDQDYVDDYRSRGEWVNWLRGAPFGPTGRADDPGLGIPVDLTLAWHTDAGIDRDGTIGTLLIYDVPGMDSTRAFPNGVSRLANRDLADALQTQIVGDLRARWRPDWRRRPLWDRNYSEAARPTVPSALLELLSHQNFEDMRYALDPRFRADAARAVYKAVGRFLAEQRGEPFVVQPLAPTHFLATLDGGTVRLAWRPQPDPLEPTAMPTGYLVQTRDGDGGWSAGALVAVPEVEAPAPPPGLVRSYRVVAVNDGGASRPSAALAVGVAPGGGPPVLVVDAFDRIAAPDTVDRPDAAGFVGPVGVPDGVGVVTVGPQVVFDPGAAYVSDAEPGWGASTGELETTVIAGNTFDHAAAHGEALLAAGRSFVSATDEAVEAGAVRLGDYAVVDLAFGLERRTPGPDAVPAFEALTPALRDRLGAYLDGGGRLIVSGAHWASDALVNPEAATWVRDRLGVEAAAGVDDAAGLLGREEAFLSSHHPSTIPFRSEYGPDGYAVRRPDALTPTSDARGEVMYVSESDILGPGASVVTGRTVSFGVPVGAVPNPELRSQLMRAALGWLGR